MSKWHTPEVLWLSRTQKRSLETRLDKPGYNRNVGRNSARTVNIGSTWFVSAWFPQIETACSGMGMLEVLDGRSFHVINMVVTGLSIRRYAWIRRGYTESE
jgi:hypothetical protein